MALQILISSGECEQFFRYYDIALSRFKSELNQTFGYLSAGTLCAGCLLCTVGIYQGVIWTLHLVSLQNLLDWSGDLAHLDVLHRHSMMHLIEVLGLMDLPTFVIGRTTPVLGIWKYFRNSLNTAGQTPAEGVEPVSGLPRSLIDIFARIDQPEAELDFWLWSGEIGEYLQQQLWDAHRFAGMLRHRQLRSTREKGDEENWEPPVFITLPGTEYLVNRILSALSAILLGLRSDQGQGLLLQNSLAYCITAVALEPTLLHKHPEWRETLDQVIHDSSISDTSKSSVGLYNILWAAQEHTEAPLDVDEAARAMQMEISLF